VEEEKRVITEARKEKKDHHQNSPLKGGKKKPVELRQEKRDYVLGEKVSLFPHLGEGPIL